MTDEDGPFRVIHIPNVPGKPFIAPARSLEEACAISVVLGQQHLFLLEENLIHDYSNVISIQQWDGDEWEDLDGCESGECAYEEFADEIMEAKP